nr:hypothetical protein EUGRSUZ_I01852 [Ipomoea batatas]
MPGRGDGKRNGSEERKWGSQCFSTLNEMRQPRDALLLTPQGSETELNLSLVRQDPIDHEHRKVLLFANPIIPLNLKSQHTPEPLNITPLNPQSFACCAVTVPISTNRCFQIRLPVDISSNSSIREANCCVKESISLHKPRGRSCATPPGCMKLACILAPETLS